jgi:predicted nucleotidyltransferase
VYLFGSQAREKSWNRSDVDLAVLLGSSLANERHGLMSIFRSNNIDLVILNDAPPLLTYEGVIRRGRLLFEKDRLARIRFEVRAFQEYVDTAPLREVQNRYLKEAIRARAATLPPEDGKQGHTW